MPSLPAPAALRRRQLLALLLPPVMAVAGAALSICATPAQAQPQAAGTSTVTSNGPTAEPELAAAFARFQQAGPDNHAAVDDAAQQFQQLSAAHPADPVLRAYAGAALSMRAITTRLPWRKMSYAEDGLALIDKALAQLDAAHDAPLHRQVPAVLETRFIAASTFLGLPGMFNRNERGRALLQQVLDSPLLASAPAPFRATVWLRAARLADADNKADQARAWYEKVAASGTPQAAQAQARLKQGATP